MTHSFDRTTFTRRIRIKSTAAKLYQAWASADGLSSWFLRDASYFDTDGNERDGVAVKGDQFIWHWHGWNHEFKGEVLAAEEGDEFSFTFGEAGKVSVRFEQLDEQCEIVLTQSEIGTDEVALKNYYIGCSLGWSFWMVNLKAWVEHGITLNERDIDFNKLEVFEYANG